MSNFVNIDSYILLRHTYYLKYYTCIFIGSFFLIMYLYYVPYIHIYNVYIDESG